MKIQLRTNRNKRKEKTEKINVKLNTELNKYGVKLIKVIGIVGLIIGFVVLILFYFLVFTKLF